MFQELFAISKTIGCSVENSELRVVHNSLISDAVKDGEVSYLAEVLSALEEKYKERKSRVKQFACWVVSKLRSCAICLLGCLKAQELCKAEEENEDPIKTKEEKEKVLMEVKKLEEAHIEFAKKFGAENEAL